MGLASGCDGDRCRLCSARRPTARREGGRTAAGTLQGDQGTLPARGLSSPAHGGRVGRRAPLSAGALSRCGRKEGGAQRVSHPLLGRQEDLPGRGAGQGRVQ